MVDNKVLLTYGALLHDVGKIVYRGISASGTHSELGASFITQEIAPHNPDYAGEAGRCVVEQIRFHHAGEIRSASCLADDSLAYVTYFADNISAGMDRKNEGDEGQARYFNKDVKLRKIFNILNGHHDDNVIEHEDYNAIRERIKQGLIATEVSDAGVNSVLNLLEATTDTVPSSTDMSQLIDVSLYDHSKTTACIAACIFDYLNEQAITDYRSALFDRRESAKFYEEDMFLLYSCDMSGIQDFIYNISGNGALKQLRARSLYLEMLVEHVVDELLVRLGLSRANLLYTGGGHAYLLLPNTQVAKRELEAFGRELEKWLLENYRTDLYVAHAWVECSANDLKNEGADKSRYPSLYRRVSEKLSEKKISRYSAEVFRSLNKDADCEYDRGRECKECHRSDLHIDKEGKCTLCAALGRISKDLAQKDTFVIMPTGGEESERLSGGLVLPFGRRLVMYAHDDYVSVKPDAIRVYTKNNWHTGIRLATHIWMGDYVAERSGSDLSAYANQSVTLKDEYGISRLGVLRADVDNLGATFVSGLPEDKVSISRTATLSRALSRFFKLRINQILEAGQYQAQVIYSGGDDLFIVGNWSDVIYAAIDIRSGLDTFTGNGSLTLSAGIGIYDAHYPIARMAFETGELEDAAKMHSDTKTGIEKNAVSLWTTGFVYSWDDFRNVVEPRMREIARVFDENEKGKAFIYRLVDLLRNADEVVSAPRLAYLLARSFEDEKDGSATSEKLYRWAMDERERWCLITAIEWYVYATRERG